MIRGALRRWLVSAAVLALVAAPAVAAPTIRGVTARGLQSGATTSLTITGSGLLPDPKLLLPVPIARQAVKPGATAARIEVEVTLNAAVTPGLYNLRVANAKGLSRPQQIAIDGLPQIPFSPQVASLPVAMHGSLSGGQIVKTSFAGKAGQGVVIDIEARRLGAKLNPVLHLYDSRRVELASAQPTDTVAGDCRLDVKLPADGEYTVELHDAQFKGLAPGHFRLKIGALHYADLVFPMGVQRGKSTLLSLVGNIPPGQQAEVNLTEAGTAAPAPWPTLPGVTGPAPPVALSDWPELVEPDGESTLEVPVPPVAINGRLAAAGEEDRYRLAVSPGSKLRFEVLAHRVGSPVDGVLTLSRENGQPLANNDDGKGTIDPQLDFTVPAGVTAVIVSIKDLHGRGGSNFLYRIAITPAASAADFELTASSDTLNVPAGGLSIVRARAQRKGYNGPIKLAFDRLPAGVTVSGDVLPAGASESMLTLRGPSASGNLTVSHLVGTAAAGEVPISRRAKFDGSSVARGQPWMISEMAVAVAESVPLSAEWSTGANLPRGTSLPGSVTITRAAGTDGPVRVVLETTQKVPVFTDRARKGKPDMSRALRAEQVEIPPGKNDARLEIIVPGDLPIIDYDLCVRAEVLSGDKKRVLATAYAPVVRLKPITLLRLELAGSASVEAAAGDGPTGKLSGVVHREEGLAGPVTLALTGLSKEITPPELVVPADKKEFEYEIRVPYGTRMGDQRNVKLVATAVPDASKPKQVVRSAAIAVNLKVVPGTKPAK